MDAHRDPALDIMAPPPLGQIQRRPFVNTLNIDRHEPQLERGAPDRDRRVGGQREIRRAARRQERHRLERRHEERTKTVISESAQSLTTKQLQMCLVMGLTIGMMLVHAVSSFYDAKQG